MICPNCAQEIPEGKKFCGYCGHRFANGVAEQGGESSTRPSVREPEEYSATVIAPRKDKPEPVYEDVDTAPQPESVSKEVKKFSEEKVGIRRIPVWVWGIVGALVVVVVVILLNQFTSRGAEALPTVTSIAMVATDISPESPTSSVKIPCDQAKFVSDVTIPDDSVLSPGSTFTKTWRLENTGSCTWSSAYSLVFDHGAAMGGSKSAQLSGSTVSPGQTIDISVDLIAPTTPGTYQGYWKLRNPGGEVFGLDDDGSLAFWVKIRVETASSFKACQVTDVGGIDDKSFNATAWKGIEDAMADLGVEGKYLESQQQTDYEVNINAFLEEGCDLIISVGFLLGDATAAAAGANPDQMFGIVDVNWLQSDNLYGSGFGINEATFLAGYLAAGMTETGIVATYGGINIPPVAVFMDGFVLGVEKYNEVHGTDVQTLGWDYVAQDGLFVGNFESTDDGRTMGESLMDEGADIIMPVAGPVGAGTLAVMEERGAGLIIGVDNDWSVQFANQSEYVLASALKNMDLYVYETIKAAMDGTFAGGNYMGTLDNGGVGLGYGGVDVPGELRAEIDALIPRIVSGEISTLP